MNIKSKTEISLEKFEKCLVICDSNCPLGQLYDFSCALRSFILNKIDEAEKQMDKKPEVPPPEALPEE